MELNYWCAAHINSLDFIDNLRPFFSLDRLQLWNISKRTSIGYQIANEGPHFEFLLPFNELVGLALNSGYRRLSLEGSTKSLGEITKYQGSASRDSGTHPSDIEEVFINCENPEQYIRIYFGGIAEGSNPLVLKNFFFPRPKFTFDLWLKIEKADLANYFSIIHEAELRTIYKESIQTIERSRINN